MNTKILLVLSSIFMAVMGVLFTFFPQEILSYLEVSENRMVVILLQVLGGLYIGFASVNWSVKDSIFGGIYNKPILLGNTIHFVVASMALGKACFSISMSSSIILLIMTIIYGLLAILFVSLHFIRPKLKQPNS